MDIPSMSIIAWLVVGAIAGFLASEIMGTHEDVVLMVALGIVGAIIGGWISVALFDVRPTGIDLTTIIIAVVGSIIVILLYDAMAGRRRFFGRRRRF